jgi:hypothetical protein
MHQERPWGEVTFFKKKFFFSLEEVRPAGIKSIKIHFANKRKFTLSKLCPRTTL